MIPLKSESEVPLWFLGRGWESAKHFAAFLHAVIHKKDLMGPVYHPIYALVATVPVYLNQTDVYKVEYRKKIVFHNTMNRQSFHLPPGEEAGDFEVWWDLFRAMERIHFRKLRWTWLDHGTTPDADAFIHLFAAMQKFTKANGYFADALENDTRVDELTVRPYLLDASTDETVSTAIRELTKAVLNYGEETGFKEPTESAYGSDRQLLTFMSHVNSEYMPWQNEGICSLLYKVSELCPAEDHSSAAEIDSSPCPEEWRRAVEAFRKANLPTMSWEKFDETVVELQYSLPPLDKVVSEFARNHELNRANIARGNPLTHFEAKLPAFLRDSVEPSNQPGRVFGFFFGLLPNFLRSHIDRDRVRSEAIREALDDFAYDEFFDKVTQTTGEPNVTSTSTEVVDG